MSLQNQVGCIDIVSKAKSAAKDLDLIDMIDEAYFEDSDSTAKSKLATAVALCDALG